jgi:uncharacterized protein (DUF1501 family)
MLSRRRFLQTSSLVSLSPLLPCILGNTARAAAAAPDSRALVVIQLDGGNDGLNTVVPFADDGYAKARDKLRLETGELHKLDDRVALHRSMKAAKGLFDDGRLCVVQGVGYPNPDRSHFRSMRIWQTATFDDGQHNSYGWLGRTLDQPAPMNHGGPAKAIYVGDQETPVALWSRRSEATALASAEDLELTLKPSTAASPPDSKGHGPALGQFVSKQVLSAYAAADEFARNRAGKQTASVSTYPDTTLGSNLRLISELLQSGAQSRVYYAIQGGYDTHSAQLYPHSRLLREFSDALAAFLNDLKAAKLDDRVVVLAFSEFGRRVKENDSQGTDHGTAGPVFLAGSPVRGGLVGNAPDLANLDGGDLNMQIDFRQVYATILDDWLEVDSKNVLGASFEKLRVLSA